MMFKIFAVCVVACFATACGKDFECSKNERGGAFLMEFDKQGGSCGDIPPMIGVIDEGSDAGCTYSHVSASDDQCSFSMSGTCIEGETTTKFSGKITQEDEDADTLSAVLTFNISVADYGSCVGTYDVTYTRQ